METLSSLKIKEYGFYSSVNSLEDLRKQIRGFFRNLATFSGDFSHINIQLSLVKSDL